MKKYPILIVLVGLVAISLSRVSLISSASSSEKTLLTVQEMKEKVNANPLQYSLVYARISKLFDDYDAYLKQYKAATSAESRAKIQSQMDKVRQELGKWIY